MKSEELSKKLEEQKQKIDFLRSQMDILYSELQQAMPQAAATWMNQEVERKIKDNSEVVTSLGPEKLKDFKSKLNELINRLPDIVAIEFKSPAKWPHHIDAEQEIFLDQAFRNVINNLGSLLDEFNVIKEPEGHYPTWKRISQGKFYYAIGLGYDYLPESKKGEYNNLYREYTSLVKELKYTEKLLSETKAKELWDQT